MAHERAALAARNIQIVAISPDSAQDSRDVADTYNIKFPLLEDKALTFSKAYAGVDTGGFPLPSIFVLKPDGSVFFRRIGSAVHDQVYVPKLLEIVDRMTGQHNLAQALGYEFDLQTRVGGGLGVDDDQSFAADVELATLYSLGPYLSIGIALGASLAPDRELYAAGLFRARMPYWKGVGEAYLQLPIGVARKFSDDGFENTGLHYGLSLGNEVEVTPRSFMYTELSLVNHRFASEDSNASNTSTRFTFQLGIGRKF